LAVLFGHTRALEEQGTPLTSKRLTSIVWSINSQPSTKHLLVPGKPELREHKAVFVIGDQEVSQFSDEITVNCAPLV
jgi:hypothetical protein